MFYYWFKKCHHIPANNLIALAHVNAFVLEPSFAHHVEYFEEFRVLFNVESERRSVVFHACLGVFHDCVYDVWVPESSGYIRGDLAEAEELHLWVDLVVLVDKLVAKILEFDVSFFSA